MGFYLFVFYCFSKDMIQVSYDIIIRVVFDRSHDISYDFQHFFQVLYLKSLKKNMIK